jgi:hypothetical protein
MNPQGNLPCWIFPVGGAYEEFRGATFKSLEAPQNMPSRKNRAAARRSRRNRSKPQADAVCRYIRQWIDTYRNDMYIAVALDRLLQLMNSYLEEVGEEGLDNVKITKEDVKKCIDSTVKVVAADNGREVLWLWGGRLLRDVINKIIAMAGREGEAAVAAGII